MSTKRRKGHKLPHHSNWISLRPNNTKHGGGVNRTGSNKPVSKPFPVAKVSNSAANKSISPIPTIASGSFWTRLDTPKIKQILRRLWKSGGMRWMLSARPRRTALSWGQIANLGLQTNQIPLELSKLDKTLWTNIRRNTAYWENQCFCRWPQLIPASRLSRPWILRIAKRLMISKILAFYKRDWRKLVRICQP